MSLRSLLQKEVHWSARNVLVLVFLLLLLPAFFAGASMLFQDVLPRDVPVAVTPADDSVEESDLELVEGGLASFTDPTRAEDFDQAQRMLERESVYAIVEVPPDIRQEGASATFRFVVDGAIVPFLSPSEVIETIATGELDDVLAADITVEREIVGEERGLPAYLFPSVLLVLVMFFSLTYIPYNLRAESTVLDRLRVESSIEAVVTAKLLFFTLLFLLPILVFHGASLYYGYDVATLAPGAVIALLGTFLFLSMVSSTIMLLARLRGVGLFVNATLLLGLVALSALAFPLGFFSSLRTTIAQLLPTYYAGILVRSTMLKGSEMGTFLDWYAAGAVLLGLAALALKGSIVLYRRQS